MNTLLKHFANVGSLLPHRNIRYLMKFRHIMLLLVMSSLLRAPIEEILDISGFSASNMTSVSMLVQYAAMLGFGLLLLRKFTISPHDMFGRLKWSSWLALGVAFGVALCMFSLGARGVFAWMMALVNTPFAYEYWGFHAGRYYVSTPWPAFVLHAMVFFVVAPVIEEFLFRGLMLRSLQKHGVVRAILLVSLIFGALHIGRDFFGAFVFSCVLCFVYLKSASLWVVSLAHVTSNVLAYLASYKYQFHFQRSMTEMVHLSDWIPELVMLAVSMVFLVMALARLSNRRLKVAHLEPAQ